ncbi:hypothetical protein PsYK624_019760 [Phanerochaete sordida]|uniref:Uncharacterized protein n=1 Tax=Phanerochaete sordida TaxID=48140 RepID=A0A9P3FZ35_9APHY|nr:hypothetical protein PsYK624_019760 [Phanerochaete sordida]
MLTIVNTRADITAVGAPVCSVPTTSPSFGTKARLRLGRSSAVTPRRPCGNSTSLFPSLSDIDATAPCRRQQRGC